MKKLIFFILVITGAYFIYGFYGDENQSDFQVSPIPDVLGNINVLEHDGTSHIYNISESDSFPNFPGFPINILGSFYEEGGIACNMDTDPEYEILYCVSTNVQGSVYAWNFDGTSVPGWPKAFSFRTQGAPAFGDIDGDGQGEVVVGTSSGSSSGNIYAYRKNGTLMPGFPINHGYTSRTIVLADIDNNGSMEIITNKRLSSAGEVWVYKGDGTVFPGWPKAINHVPASSSAVGDITGDGFPEIVSESYSSLYAWDRNGNPLTGFPFTMPNDDVNSYSSPVLADVDGDNIREITFGTHALGGGGYVYLLKNNATIMSGWPKPTPYWIYSPPSVGYIDGDNVLDIAIGDGGGTISGSPVFKLYAWNKNGTALTGFPVAGLWAINNQPLIADVDNDNQMELIIDDNTTTNGQGKYLGFNHNGTPLTGNWPLITSGSTMFSTPVLWDVNRDGILDIAGSGAFFTSPQNTNVYLWNTGIPFNTAKITVPMWQYNTRHNGVYGDNNLVGITPLSNEIPNTFSLSQNYPNPFNPSTHFGFRIADFGFVKLSIYDILGRKITQLVNEELKPGVYDIEWNASNQPSGVYFYTLRAGDYRDTKKMMLIK